MGDSDVGDRLPPPSSSDELSSFLRQILSRTPTAQPASPPKGIVYSAETFPSSSVAQEKYGFENKVD